MDAQCQMPEQNSTIEHLNDLLLQSQALAAVDSGIVITDDQARIVWVNPAFGKSTGYPAEELLGRTPRILRSGSHDQSFYREFWDTILAGETWRGQFVNRRRDGSLCVHAQTTTPVRWHSGGPITHFISVNEDMTSRRPCEKDSSEIRSMEAVGRLAAGLASQFNNLLTVIHCNSGLLLQLNGDSHPESRNLVEGILETSRRAAHLVRQLVSFSQSQVLQFQALDLNRVVEDAVRVFRRTARGKIEWECRYCSSLPAVLADSGMLAQVVCHLLANALDAMPEGGRLTLTTKTLLLAPSDIWTHPAGRPGEFVCLTIRDTGCGIAPTDLSRIFDPFFTTKDSPDHTGLGLALVHGIVKQHHGWTEASSEAGRGATFTTFLPAMTEVHARAAAALVQPEPGGLPQPAIRLLPRPEPGDPGTSVRQPSAGGKVLPVNQVRGEPLIDWGINE